MHVACMALPYLFQYVYILVYNKSFIFWSREFDFGVFFSLNDMKIIPVSTMLAMLFLWGNSSAPCMPDYMKHNYINMRENKVCSPAC